MSYAAPTNPYSVAKIFRFKFYIDFAWLFEL